MYQSWFESITSTSQLFVMGKGNANGVPFSRKSQPISITPVFFLLEFVLLNLLEECLFFDIFFLCDGIVSFSIGNSVVHFSNMLILIIPIVSSYFLNIVIYINKITPYLLLKEFPTNVHKQIILSFFVHVYLRHDT